MFNFTMAVSCSAILAVIYEAIFAAKDSPYQIYKDIDNLTEDKN